MQKHDSELDKLKIALEDELKGAFKVWPELKPMVFAKPSPSGYIGAGIKIFAAGYGRRLKQKFSHGPSSEGANELIPSGYEIINDEIRAAWLADKQTKISHYKRLAAAPDFESSMSAAPPSVRSELYHGAEDIARCLRNYIEAQAALPANEVKTLKASLDFKATPSGALGAGRAL